MSTSPFTGRVSLTFGSAQGTQTLTTFSEVAISRDLRDVSATFELGLYDAARAEAAFPGTAQSAALALAALTAGAQVTIAIDGAPVLVGYIDIVEGEVSGDSLSFRARGRDKTGDLVDCACAPSGPAEWRGLGLLAIAQAICAPFGLAVSAQTPLGAPFPSLAVAPGESAMVVLEKAARQRAVLVVSDGVGGVLLTSGGKGSAPAPLLFGENIQKSRYRFDWTRRFSDVYVKGQTARAAGQRHGLTPAFAPGTAPLAVAVPASFVPSAAQAVEAAGALMVGHAQDPAVTRYRPIVKTTRTQSGASSVQVQAEWWTRVLRGESVLLAYTVLDWRAGAASALWVPNQLVRVSDPVAGIDEEMLVRKVLFRFGADAEGESGIATTEIEVVGPTAFDQTDQAAPKRGLRPHQAPYPTSYGQFPERPQ